MHWGSLQDISALAGGEVLGNDCEQGRTIA
jgi:hypothetical protein